MCCVPATVKRYNQVEIFNMTVWKQYVLLHGIVELTEERC